jgi:hypothetical protein
LAARKSVPPTLVREPAVGVRGTPTLVVPALVPSVFHKCEVLNEANDPPKNPELLVVDVGNEPAGVPSVLQSVNPISGVVAWKNTASHAARND